MNDRLRDSILKLYEQEDMAVAGSHDWLFRAAVLFSFLFFGACGWYLRTHNPPQELLDERAAKIRQVSFLALEQKKPKLQSAPVKAEPKPVVKPKVKKEEPVDLTVNPVLAQKVDDVKPEPPPEEKAPEVRRVYGLRKVYATGIGAEGLAADAVIGKQGNTLNADIDSTVATKEDLKGKIAPVTTITSLPRPLKIVKPEYTKAMIEAGIEGIIRAKILISAIGKVIEVIILNDLGYGSRESARAALLQCVFEPAKRGTEPVATWYIIPINFILDDE